MKIHINSVSPFTVAWEALTAAIEKETVVKEESVGSKWVTAMQENTASEEEEDVKSRDRNGSMSTRFTLDSVMGSGYLLFVTLISIAIMFAGNYTYYSYKRKEEIEAEKEHKAVRA